MSRIPRPDIANWFTRHRKDKSYVNKTIPTGNQTWGTKEHWKNKTDGGKVKRTSVGGGAVHFSDTHECWWNCEETEDGMIHHHSTDDIEPIGKELFDMVYQWGRVGVVTDHTCYAFQVELDNILHRTVSATDRRKEALDLCKDYLHKIHGEPSDGRLLDRWIEIQKGYDE